MKHTILHLSLIPNVGPAVVNKLVDRHNADRNIDRLYSLSAEALRAEYGVSAEMASTLWRGLQDTAMLTAELALIEKYAINWATPWCERYPGLLKQIHLPPTVIYWYGTLPVQDCIAFVGSRNNNEYGEYVIQQLVPPLVAAGWCIVSGGALGVDTAAHATALKGGGATVAVLGSGLLELYPVRNKKLFNEIVRAGGAVVSSFPLRMQGLPGNFPARNRIIAGLSRGTVVAQAAAKSGALITARYAVDQGREVFAVPGNIGDPLSAGCHGLIAQGARLVTSAKDIMGEFGIAVPEVQLSIMQPMPAFDQPAVAQRPQRTGPSGAVIQACAQPASVEDIATKTGIPFAEVQDLLFDLQLEGAVTQNYAGLWELP